MKRLTLTLLCIFFFCASYAQHYAIKGILKDTLNNNPLPYASVTLLRASDSVLETYTRAKDDGSFQLGTDSPGKYIILVTFPGFANYVDEIRIKDKAVTDIGLIPMLTRAQVMKEVVFTKERAAIKIKGDTVEYVADSFKTKDNATVEELLKKLPGLEVDRNGQITAQGEQVQKIMVDGEEFFADDPAMVTKSLQAKIIDKVQVFNKKSEQAEFTGIDDGQKIKTINLQLKDKYKKGYLGKADAGAGNDGFYQANAMLSAFRNKSQFAAFGIASNTNKVGLGYNDRNKFGLNNSNTVITDEGQSITYYNNNDNGFDSWDGTYSGEGLPKVWTGGLHFSDKWNNDASHIQGDYRFARQNVEATSNAITQYVLPDSAYYTKQNLNQFSTSDKHSYSGMYEWKPDTNTTVKFNADAGYRTSEILSRYIDSTITPHDVPINSDVRNISTKSDNKFFNAAVLYRRKFAKKGRTISAEFKENTNTTISDGYLNTSSNYYTNTPSVKNIDQRKTNNTEAIAFSGKLTYTEPLTKKVFLILNYATSVHNNTSKNYSYNKPGGTGAYDALDTVYSSNYIYNVWNNSGGADIRLQGEKLRFSFGGDIAETKYKQVDNLLGIKGYNNNYLNFFPRASLNIAISKQKSFQISYSGKTQQPSIEQIQPLRQNTDPNNIAIGNPSLKQQFNNSFNFNYNSYKMLKRQYTYAGGGFTFTKDAISQSITTTGFGRSYQYVNTDGNYSGWAYGGHHIYIKKLDLQAAVHSNINISHSTQFVNGEKNVSDNNSFNFSLSFAYEKKDKYSLELKPGATYNDNHATISTYSTSYWQADPSFEASVFLPFRFEIGSDVEWLYRQQTALFDRNNNIVRWNAYLKKKLLKSGQLLAYVNVYDILNQNIGYNRFGQSNYVQENTYNTITRYTIIGLEWNFSKTGGGGDDNTKLIKKM